MKVSLNTIKKFTSVDLPVDQLVVKINSQLGGVEDLIDLNDVYKDAIIVKVVECQPHPNADKLHVCKVDDGKATKDVPRDKNGLVEVVCGAPNVHADMFAVWLPPQSIVPASYHDAEPFVLGARELRGVMSNGMLASAKELALGDNHDGILELTNEDTPPWFKKKLEAGLSFSETFGLNDTIIDIENKMFTHRPDCFGQVGVAREIAGIQHLAFKSPDWYTTASVDTLDLASPDTLDLAVFNETPENVPRFMAAVVKNVAIKPSPVWLQAELVRLGAKPINNVVDMTNYVMLITAQPTHAYDYDKLRGKTLGARLAKKGEKVELLNHKTYQLDETDIVIVDGEGPVGLAGIMGGGDSEVSSTTTNLVLECANFDMYAVRRSSMKHGLFTDALTRFNKGQSPHQNLPALRLLIESIIGVAGGEVASQIFDEKSDLKQNQPVNVTAEYINQRLGLSLSDKEIMGLLKNVEFNIEPGLVVTAPFWRTDIELPEDVIEEVGRLYGFDNLPRELPQRSITPAAVNQLQQSKQAVREKLSKLGANEVLTYSFVHEKLLERADQTKEHAFKVSNALSPDLQYYRLSLMPSLLDKVHMNIKSGYDEFTLFEQNKVHFKGEMDVDEPEVPNEDNHIALVIAYGDKKAPKGAPFYHARKYLASVVNLDDYSLSSLAGFDVDKDEWGKQLTSAYEPNRSAVIARDGQIWGVVGEFKSNVQTAFKLPKFVAGFEVHAEVLAQSLSQYRSLSRFPSVTQDLSLITDKDVDYQLIQKQVVDSLAELDDSLTVSYEPTSIYSAIDSDQKTTTFRIKVAHFDRTLLEGDVSTILDSIIKRAAREIGATV